PRDDGRFLTRELADVVRSVPLPVGSAVQVALCREPELIESGDDCRDVVSAFDTHAKELAATINLDGLDGSLLFDLRQHGRKPRASTEARSRASGEAAESKHVTQAGSSLRRTPRSLLQVATTHETDEPSVRHRHRCGVQVVLKHRASTCIPSDGTPRAGERPRGGTTGDGR